MEFMKLALEKFFTDIGWKESYYSSLELHSRRILWFDLPQTMSVNIGKSVTHELKSAYSLGSGSETSLAYLYSNPNGANIVKRLFYGRIFKDGHLEALYCSNWNNYLFLASAVDYWSFESRRNLQLQFIHNVPQLCTEMSFNSDNEIFGVSSVGRVSENWRIGSEIFYTHKERSGGMSIGSAFTTYKGETVDTVTTFMANPIMGHLRSSFFGQVTNNVKMATQYDFNMYSFMSDISFGVEISPNNTDGHTINAAVSLAKGISLSICSKFENVMTTIGFGTSFSNSPLQRFGISVEIA